MPQLKSQGVCLYCKQTFSKTTINRHLQKHLASKAKENQTGKSFLLKIETYPRWESSYFLFLWTDGEVAIKDIDNFLRDIWLECCGHLSSFTNKSFKKVAGNMWDFFEAEKLLDAGKENEYEKLMEQSRGEIPKSRKLKNTLDKDMKIEYQYDFGNTTELLITVAEVYSVCADQKIVLLSRNEPPELYCSICHAEPAVKICTVCMNEGESVFCKKCAKLHAKPCEDFADYAAMPIVNSPRMGVCGYEGGVIDTERDGVFVKKNAVS